MPACERIGWWLALEPVGAAGVAWALSRIGDAPVRGPIDAGLHDDLYVERALVGELLPRAGGSTTTEEQVESLWSSPLTRSADERRYAIQLGQALLPAVLRRELVGEVGTVRRHTVTIACRGWLAQVPWDVLALDGTGDVRLLERARVLAGFSPALAAGRRRVSLHRSDAPVLRVIDPGPRTDRELKPLYAATAADVWDRPDAGGFDLTVPDGVPFSAAALSDALRVEPGFGRLFYLGHALSGTPSEPAGAALVLSFRGRRDLLTAHSWLTAPKRWPCPNRVAIIACASDDAAQLEQSGLPVAALNAGAELLTVTRWMLPTDLAPPQEVATTALALAVDASHSQPDPVGALQTWQRDQLERWRRTSDRRYSPLLWGALATYWAPAVEVDAGTG